MSAWILGLCIAVLGRTPVVETRFVQVAPRAAEGQIQRSGLPRAVILIPGFHFPVTHEFYTTAQFHSYQLPDSLLVRCLAGDSDVFAFAYSENVAVCDPTLLANLRTQVQKLRTQGYSEIVLAGFSTGGLIARQLVEDNPDAGVTKVIQVCTPNLGTVWAFVSPLDALAQSLTPEARSRFLHERSGKRIPDAVQFACVVGTGMCRGDGIVSIHSQWPEDLQSQGIPAYLLPTGHLLAVRTGAGTRLIAELIRDYQPRWTPEQVERMKKRLRFPCPTLRVTGIAD